MKKKKNLAKDSDFVSNGVFQHEENQYQEQQLVFISLLMQALLNQRYCIYCLYVSFHILFKFSKSFKNLIIDPFLDTFYKLFSRADLDMNFDVWREF